MNVPNEEARELMGEIGGRGMGILFEHAEKERADAEKRRADEAETELAELRQKLARLEAEK